MTRPQVEKRKPLTRAQFGQLMIDQEGKCGCGCGQKLQPMGEGVIDEHVRALGLLGGNDLSNRSLWRKPCSKAKTDKEDLPRLAKAKRQGLEKGQQARRAKRVVSSIKSAGFPKINRKLNGSVGPTQAAARAANDQSPLADGEAA